MAGASLKALSAASPTSSLAATAGGRMGDARADEGLFETGHSCAASGLAARRDDHARAPGAAGLGVEAD